MKLINKSTTKDSQIAESGQSVLPEINVLSITRKKIVPSSQTAQKETSVNLIISKRRVSMRQIVIRPCVSLIM